MYKIWKVILFTLFLVLLSSCGFKDIDKRAFVVSMGIDKADNLQEGYKVTLKIAIPSPNSKEEAKEALLLTEEGKSIGEIVAYMKGKISNELDFGHMKMIIFGDKILSEDLRELLDWFVRRRDVQKIAFVAVGKPDALTILNLKPKIERLPSNSFFIFFEDTGTESAYVTTKYLFDFRRDIRERGIDAYLPVVEENESGGFTIAKLKISKKEKKLLELTEEETKIFNILNMGYDKFNIRVDIDEKNYFVLDNESITVKFKIKGRNMIEFNIDFKSLVEESTIVMVNEKMDYYNHLAEETLKKEVKELLTKLQENDLDPLGFGVRYRATHMGSEDEKVQRWNKLYPNLTFKVHVKSEIKGTGIVE